MTFEELLNVPILMYFDRSIVPVFDFHAEKPSCDSEILHVKSFAEAPFNRGDIFLVVPSNDEIVNVESDVCAFAVGILVNENAGIRFALLEVEVDQDCCDQLNPCSWRLLQSVQCSSEETNIVLFTRCDESFWLFDIYSFIKIAIEEGCVDVHLVDFVVLATGEECEESANGGVLGDGCESFVVVFSPSLSEPFGAETSFVEVVGVLNLENPVRFDDFCRLRMRDEGPGVILHD